jgi:PmbA protein
MRSTQREALAAHVLELAAAADQAEVLVASGDSALSRFSHEACTQNVAAGDVNVSIRAIANERTGVARTNRLDEEHLRDVVERAIAMARLAPPDPHQPQLPAGGPCAAPPGAYDEQTARAGADRRAAMCDAIFREAERNRQWCAGYVETACEGFTVVNSSGARASFDGTQAAINVKMNAADSTGFAEFYGPAVGGADASAAGRAASEKARDAARPCAVEPGEWTVILEPSAFGELFAYLAPHFSAQSFDEGSSAFSDGLDRRYFGDNVEIWDDFSHPLSPGMPFDFEGQPTLRLPLVQAGTVRNVVTDSYYAHKLGRPNTGHALPAPNARGPQACHTVVKPGPKPLAQLVEETQRGLLITRLWYVRPVDRKRAIVTGMTRDGTFLIENGRVTRGVKNLRFNQSIVDALQSCEFANRPCRTGQYSYSLVTPAAKLERFAFTSVTEF